MPSEYRYDFSVLMITFNHEKFIQQSVESILRQEFEGSFQIVIGVDKSTDKTLEVCQSLQNRHPNIIYLLEHTENVGMFKNFYLTLSACTGKYIAILEGDDYWTDCEKLKLQYEYFEKHPNCILSAGKVDTVDENSNLLSKATSRGGKGEVLFKEDLIIINQLNTLTTGFRKSAIDLKEIEKLDASPHLDWSFYLSLKYQKEAYIYRFNRIFGAYRHHAGGVYSQIAEEKRNENILKTIYSIYNLNIELCYKTYLKSLYANFTLKLKSTHILSEEPYSKFFDANLVIYRSDGSLNRVYLNELYKSAFNFVKNRNNQAAFRLKWELLRQTRLSKKNYLNFFLLPLFPAVLLLKQRVKSRKSQIQNL